MMEQLRVVLDFLGQGRLSVIFTMRRIALGIVGLAQPSKMFPELRSPVMPGIVGLSPNAYCCRLCERLIQLAAISLNYGQGKQCGAAFASLLACRSTL